MRLPIWVVILILGSLATAKPTDDLMIVPLHDLRLSDQKLPPKDFSVQNVKLIITADTENKTIVFKGCHINKSTSSENKAPIYKPYYERAVVHGKLVNNQLSFQKVDALVEELRLKIKSQTPAYCAINDKYFLKIELKIKNQKRTLVYELNKNKVGYFVQQLDGKKSYITNKSRNI